MKPVQIALLVIAGAVGGAVLMKVVERPDSNGAAPAVAQNSTPAAAVPTPALEAPVPEAPPAAAPAEPEAKPSPVRERHALPRSHEVHHRELAYAQAAAVPQAPPAPVAAAASIAAQPQPQPVPEPAAPAPQPENATPAPPPQPRQVTLNAGLLFPVRLIDALSSERNNPGDTFAGTLDQPLRVDDLVIAERGARVEGRVVLVDRGSRIKGVSILSVELTRVHLSDGQSIAVHTDSFEKRTDPDHNVDAAKVGGGAVLGAVIGAIAGGGKGAAIGAGVGGGAGAGDVLLTRKPATLPSETRVTFRLNAPLTVTERQGQ